VRNIATIGRQPGSGRRQSAHYTVENVDTVNDLLLSHQGRIKMHQNTCQIARETGIHHPSVYSIIHQDFQLISLKKRRAQELTYGNCVYISQTCRSCYKVELVGAYKLSVVGNTIYVLLQIFSRMLLSKNMKIGLRIKKLLQK